MDFAYDDEQKALRDAVRGLLSKAYGDWEDRRRVADEDPGYSADTWQKLAEMGVLALPFAEDDGGVGAGIAEIGIVAEEMGRVIAPEPFLTAAVLAGGAVAAVGSAEQKAELLTPLIEGAELLVWAHHDLPDAAVSADADGRLTGTKDPVVHGQSGALIVTAALPDGGLGIFAVTGDEGITRSAYPTLDGGRASTITFDNAPATQLGEGDSTAVIEGLLDIARVVAAHEVIGGMSRALEMTTDYLKSRKQFGVTLNTFQALNFRAADMYVAVELTRSVVLWSAMVLDAARASGDTSDVADAAARASYQVSVAGRKVDQEAIQLHGGIGVTAEYAVGHYLARLHTLESILGGRNQHLSTLAAKVADYAEVDPLR